MLDHRRWLGISLALAAASCTDGSASFHARYEPGFTEGPTTVAVLGVFNQGRMSRESWAQIGPPLSASLGQKSCPVAYGDTLAAANPDLYATLEDGARSEGITEELLERFATSTEAEMILVVSLNGKTSHGRGRDDGSSPTGATQPRRASGMRGGGRNQGMSQGGGRTMDVSEIGIAGTLYAVKRRRAVARVNMSYVGTNLDEAIGKFVNRLREVIPGSTCRAWRWPEADAPAAPGAPGAPRETTVPPN